jgi:hypothetical protein
MEMTMSTLAFVRLAQSGLIFAGLTILSAWDASAATIRLGYILHEQSNDSLIFRDRLEASLSDSVTDSEATSSASAQVDGRGGIIQIFSRVALQDGANVSQRQAAASASVGDGFFVTGEGTVTVLMTVNGTIQGNAGTFTADIVSNALGLTKVESAYEEIFSTNLPEAGATSFSETIGVVYEINNPGTTSRLNATWRINGNALAANDFRVATMDAGNTAYFNIIASDGVVISPFTDGFLSDPVTPVPLPASLPMFLGGILALFGLRRKVCSERLLRIGFRH